MTGQICNLEDTSSNRNEQGRREFIRSAQRPVITTHRKLTTCQHHWKLKYFFKDLLKKRCVLPIRNPSHHNLGNPPYCMPLTYQHTWKHRWDPQQIQPDCIHNAIPDQEHCSHIAVDSRHHRAQCMGHWMHIGLDRMEPPQNRSHTSTVECHLVGITPEQTKDVQLNTFPGASGRKVVNQQSLLSAIETKES